MREEAFRRFLAPRLGARSVDSYVSYLRRVEAELATDLDAGELDDHVIDTVRSRLSAGGMVDRSVSNSVSALRAYAAFRQGSTLPAPEPPHSPPYPATPASVPRALEHVPTASLLGDYAAILQELRARGIARTGNGPVGDYAEHLFARAFGWHLEPNSTAGFDARAQDGSTRYEIKARTLSSDKLRASHKPRAQLGALRRLPERRFDQLAVLLFSPDLAVHRAMLIPHEVVIRYAVFRQHTNSWQLIVTPALSALPEVMNVTDRVAAAAGSSSAGEDVRGFST